MWESEANLPDVLLFFFKIKNQILKLEQRTEFSYIVKTYIMRLL